MRYPGYFWGVYPPGDREPVESAELTQAIYRCSPGLDYYWGCGVFCAQHDEKAVERIPQFFCYH